MTHILLLDSSSEACSVALLKKNQKLSKFKIAPRQHAKLILPMVDELLQQSQLELSQLDAIACHLGPGTFTGIRVAVSAAQGLAYAAGLPAIGLSTLANLAIQGWQKTANNTWLACIDARMQEVYFAAFRVHSASEPELIIEQQVIKPQAINFKQLLNELAEPADEIGLVGNGWAAYAEDFFNQATLLNKQNYLPDIYPDAVDSLDYAKALFEQQQLLKPQELQPVYLRNKVVG